jgi:hypothetical protein
MCLGSEPNAGDGFKWPERQLIALMFPTETFWFVRLTRRNRLFQARKNAKHHHPCKLKAMVLICKEL